MIRGVFCTQGKNYDKGIDNTTNSADAAARLFSAPGRTKIPNDLLVISIVYATKGRMYAPISVEYRNYIKFLMFVRFMSQIQFPCVCRCRTQVSHPKGDKAAGQQEQFCRRCISSGRSGWKCGSRRRRGRGNIVDEQFIKSEDTVALMESTYNG